MCGVAKTHPVAAAVRAESGRCRDGAAEPEEGVHGVQDEREERVEGEGLFEGGGDEVEEGEEAEDGDEEVVVDDAAVAVVPVVDHVADEGHDEDGPEELVMGGLVCACGGRGW